MSISARATHVMSAMLIVVLAFSAPAWTPVARTTHCSTQVEDCCQKAVLSCCGPSAPVPIERTPQQEIARPQLHVATASLVDVVLVSVATAAPPDVPSPHWVRVRDLPTLHRTFLI